jgi:hypothetical protein
VEKRIAPESPEVTYEVYYVARKYGVSSDSVRNVIKRVGNNRKKVYAALKKCRCAS